MVRGERGQRSSRRSFDAVHTSLEGFLCLVGRRREPEPRCGDEFVEARHLHDSPTSFSFPKPSFRLSMRHSPLERTGVRDAHPERAAISLGLLLWTILLLLFAFFPPIHLSFLPYELLTTSFRRRAAKESSHGDNGVIGEACPGSI